MKIDDIITETPQLIALDNVNVVDAEKECKNALSSGNYEIIEIFSKDTKLCHINGCYFLATNNTIGYLVKYSKVDMPGNLIPASATRQVLIKRFPDASPYAAGIGAKVFWNYLFPKYNCLVSDSQQTQDGKRIWEYRIAEALDKNLTVRLINTNDKTFVDIKSKDEMEQVLKTAWGKQPWFQRM